MKLDFQTVMHLLVLLSSFVESICLYSAARNITKQITVGYEMDKY